MVIPEYAFVYYFSKMKYTWVYFSKLKRLKNNILLQNIFKKAFDKFQ